MLILLICLAGFVWYNVQSPELAGNFTTPSQRDPEFLADRTLIGLAVGILVAIALAIFGTRRK